jgi:hypothetical protein
MSAEKKAEPTKGPWEWEGGPDCFADFERGQLVSAHSPEPVLISAAAVDGVGSWIEVSPVDAALIKAAPDLLAALRGALSDAVESRRPGVADPDWVRGAVRAVCKAEGKS